MLHLRFIDLIKTWFDPENNPSVDEFVKVEPSDWEETSIFCDSNFDTTPSTDSVQNGNSEHQEYDLVSHSNEVNKVDPIHQFNLSVNNGEKDLQMPPMINLKTAGLC